MDYNQENNYQNIYSPVEQKFYNSKSILNNNQIYNYNYNKNEQDFNFNNNNNLNFNTNNIFGLNFHQDEEDEDQIINSLHFSKFNMNSQNNINEENNYKEGNNSGNNFRQKINNNRNMVYNNMNLNNKNSDFVEREEPFQISVSKYSESNLDNHSIFNNSKINNNINNNKIELKSKNKREDNINDQKFKNKVMSIKKLHQNNNQEYNDNNNNNNNNNNNKLEKPHPNFIKHNLILNNNYYINNNSNITNNKNVPIIVHTKSFSSKRKPLLNKKVKAKENYNTLNNYYKIPKTKLSKNKENINKNNLMYKGTESNQKNNQINNTYTNNRKNTNINHKKHNSNSNFSVRIRDKQKINELNKNNNFNPVNESYIPKDESFKKLYSKKQKAELDMVRGCYTFDRKYFNFDIKNGTNTVNYIKFIKPTEPILQINYKNVDKFYPLIRKKFVDELNLFNTNTNIFRNNPKVQNHDSILNNDNFENIKEIDNNITNPNKKKNSKISKLIKNNQDQIPKNNQNKKSKKNLTFDFDNQMRDINLNLNIYTENIQEKDKDKDGISKILKKKIYDWLVDIDIIKDKIIKIDSLPTLCINGVLLCDLINRCEGKNEILKGIIRRTNTRSQIQVNINKVLEYLRTLEKFPSRNLWNNIEISKGNSVIIWQLLDDIYNFYGNKITFKKRQKKGINNISSNNNYLNKTFTDEKNNINKKLLNKEMIYKNINTLNTSKNNNTINNNKKHNKKINSFNINIHNNNYTKNTYTPDNYKNNIQKRRKILDDNLFKDFIENENNNFIYDNSKKLSKRGKSNNKVNNIYNNIPYKITTESSNRNNLNHTNDNFYESKMFSMDTSLDNKSNKKLNKISKMNYNNNNINKIFPKNLDISSISSDRNFISQKNNKSFSVNNAAYNKKRKYGGNQSFYSTNLEANRKTKGCFLLFEKSSINKLKEKIGNLNKYNTNDLDTLDIKDI